MGGGVARARVIVVRVGTVSSLFARRPRRRESDACDPDVDGGEEVRRCNSRLRAGLWRREDGKGRRREEGAAAVAAAGEREREPRLGARDREKRQPQRRALFLLLILIISCAHSQRQRE
jgi:hypothetical protein